MPLFVTLPGFVTLARLGSRPRGRGVRRRRRRQGCRRRHFRSRAGDELWDGICRHRERSFLPLLFHLLRHVSWDVDGILACRRGCAIPGRWSGYGSRGDRRS